MKENVLYEVLKREMECVEIGSKTPETAALSVIKEFANDRIYVSTRFIKSANLATKILELKNYGVSTADIAQRLGISTRHVRRLYASMKN